MTGVYILLGILILAVVGFGLLSLKRRNGPGDGKLLEENARLTSQLEQKIEEIGGLNREIKEVKTEKDMLQGKSKQFFADHTKLEAKFDSLQTEKDKLQKRLTELETEEKRRRVELEREISELANAKRSFEDERKRVIREDEERMAKENEDRDRMWAEHEASVIAKLNELCRSPQLAFTTYTNTNLPDEFDGTFKPDFLIDFLGQYIYFDAKVSKAESLQTYINNAVKTTISKVKKYSCIYPKIFFVVPTNAIAELKSTVFAQEGYTFYVVSPEALPSLLASLKTITTYELAEKLDPQERENIINLIAELDLHINLRNAADLILTKMGAGLLEKAAKMQPELTSEVTVKKQAMKIPNLNTSDLKRLVASSEAQEGEIVQLVSPKASVRRKDIDSAKAVIEQKLL